MWLLVLFSFRSSNVIGYGVWGGLDNIIFWGRVVCYGLMTSDGILGHCLFRYETTCSIASSSFLRSHVRCCNSYGTYHYWDIGHREQHNVMRTSIQIKALYCEWAMTISYAKYWSETHGFKVTLNWYFVMRPICLRMCKHTIVVDVPMFWIMDI